MRDDGCAGGLPTISGEQVEGEPVPFAGVLLLGPQSCVMVRLTGPAGDAAHRWEVWPTGAEHVIEDDGAGDGALVDGERDVVGDSVAGTGFVVDLAALPGRGEHGGGYYAESGRYCAAHEVGVLVIDDLRRGW